MHPVRNFLARVFASKTSAIPARTSSPCTNPLRCFSRIVGVPEVVAVVDDFVAIVKHDAIE